VATVKWVCVSDLHLGALNSVLTSVTEDGERVDPSSASPVLEALCNGLRALSPANDPPQMVVLGDLFELALSSAEDAAATFAQFMAALRPGQSDAAVARYPVRAGQPRSPSLDPCEVGPLPRVPRAGAARPGTHARAPRHPHRPGQRCRADAGPVHRAARRPGGSQATVTVEQSYPNLALVTESGHRAVVLTHGHFIEPLYRAMSTLGDLFGPRPDGVTTVQELEAENGGWIDFFWSSMGESKDTSGWVRSIYESLQSDQAIHAEIRAIGGAIANRPGSRVQNHVEALLADGLLAEVVCGSLRRERHGPGVLSERAQAGLIDFLSGPVARQVADEIGSPAEVSFVFGHTTSPSPMFVPRRGFPDRCRSSTPADGWSTRPRPSRTREHR